MACLSSHHRHRRKKKRDSRAYHDDDDDAEISEEQQNSMLKSWDANRSRGPSFLNDENVGEHTFRDRYRQVDEDEVLPPSTV